MDMSGDISDAMLIQAARKRILDQLAQQDHAERIVNNVYGSGGAGSISEAMNAGEQPQSPEDMDYFVDILRQEIPEGGEAEMTDPATGQPMKRPLPAGGWKKQVHRFSKKKVTPK